VEVEKPINDLLQKFPIHPEMVMKKLKKEVERAEKK